MKENNPAGSPHGSVNPQKKLQENLQEKLQENLQDKLQENLQDKLQHLKEILRGYGKVMIAYSGGVDSTFLCKVAAETLADNAKAVTVVSHVLPSRERKQAEDLAEAMGISHELMDLNELDIAGFAENPTNRCYLCKKDLFTRLWDLARKEGFSVLAEASNTDDDLDYRPGMQAIRELGVASPLKEARLNKQEIRILSKELGLATWDKPSFACLATRFPYGTPITNEKLDRIEKAEQLLADLGFSQYRVRYHGEVARIEILPSEMPRIFEGSLRGELDQKMKEAGFSYVALDLAGYRTGSMNEGLKT